MSKTHSDSVRQKNAKRGAVTRQCPKCQRKAAMSSWAGDLAGAVFTTARSCRYCGFVEKKETIYREV